MVALLRPSRSRRMPSQIRRKRRNTSREAIIKEAVADQFDISSNAPIGDEDCLNLNVYSPKLDSKKRAVMVYFHGGAFIMGGGASFFFGPNYLLEQNVVLVTFNYR